MRATRDCSLKIAFVVPLRGAVEAVLMNFFLQRKPLQSIYNAFGRTRTDTS